MVERIEDLNLPNAVVARLIKDALPEGANISKEARSAIARAASVFVIFLTSTSTALAHKQNHKTISSANILESLKQLEFENFVGPLEKDLEAYRKFLKEKKDIKAKKDAAAAIKGNGTESAPATESAAATESVAATEATTSMEITEEVEK